MRADLPLGRTGIGPGTVTEAEGCVVEFRTATVRYNSWRSYSCAADIVAQVASSELYWLSGGREECVVERGVTIARRRRA